MTGQMTLERLYKNFEVLDNWEDRYRFIIEMGRKIPQLSEEQKIEENRVYGCTSTVFMVVEKKDRTIDFIANSDAAIVNGLIAILMIAFSEKDAKEINSIDIKAIFDKLGLERHLTPNRRNGFFAMVDRLKKEAARLAAT